ncbi:hypothetical protein BJ875DRAFT_5726 [Amylocarpus encephaloides]|uniref:Secreted protein n=1 Tax=Amylocarpus encephaloides TaxID=45428 RepID=A0A9P7YJF9_9HELO|nr:hypothetical protein BJ875DRAFT_5726 [Amylocarpus encephaloides]
MLRLPCAVCLLPSACVAFHIHAPIREAELLEWSVARLWCMKKSSRRFSFSARRHSDSESLASGLTALAYTYSKVYYRFKSHEYASYLRQQPKPSLIVLLLRLWPLATMACNQHIGSRRRVHVHGASSHPMRRPLEEKCNI